MTTITNTTQPISNAEQVQVARAAFRRFWKSERADRTVFQFGPPICEIMAETLAWRAFLTAKGLTDEQAPF